MGIIICCLIVALLIGLFAFWLDDCDFSSLIGGIVGGLAASTLVLTIVVGASYSSYLNARTFYDSTCEQYVGAVEVYKDYAVINIEDVVITDFKYQGYQENLAKFLTTLRREIVNYNETVVSKRLMEKNWFFNWVIIAPDEDMKILKMTSEVRK